MQIGPWFQGTWNISYVHDLFKILGFVFWVDTKQAHSLKITFTFKIHVLHIHFWNDSQVPLMLQAASHGFKKLRGEKLIDIHNTHEFEICNSLNLHSGITNYILALPASVWIQSSCPTSLAFFFFFGALQERNTGVEIDRKGDRTGSSKMYHRSAHEVLL